jgi:acyl-CoA synthetase
MAFRPESRFDMRLVPDELTRRYRAEGLWTDETLGSLIHRGLDPAAEQAFVFYGTNKGQPPSVGNVGARARSIASGLVRRGIGPGDAIALKLPNGLDAVASFCAIALAGATVVPIVHYSSERETEHILRVTGARVLVTTTRGVPSAAEWLDALFGALDSLELVVLADPPSSLPPKGKRVGLDALVGEGDRDFAPVLVDPQSAAAIAFTSGTTSAPKGVIHSHESLCFEARQFAATIPPGPPLLTGAPVSHVLGLLSAVLGPLVRHQRSHLLDGWDPAAVLDLMEDKGLRAGSGPPIFLSSLLDHPRCIEVHRRLIDPAQLGGAPVTEALVRRAEELGIRVLRIYGLTEHPSVTLARVDDALDQRRRTSGRPLLGCEVRIAPDGEIQTRGPDLCMGYTDPELTAAAFDGDGWFSTGDIGSLDAEGYLTVLDRKKDIIIRGGENISALEIEEHLAVMEGVAEVAAVAAPDPRLGEIVAVFIRRSTDSAAPDLEQLRVHCVARGLARHKCPQLIEFVQDFPRTPSGKIMKARLREMLEDR